jgi:hypothetical protein
MWVEIYLKLYLMRPLIKTILILSIGVFVFSCSSNANISELQSAILQDIESKLESQGGGAEVQSFNLTHISGNEYIGILETLENGSVFSYTVNVISDGNSFVWEIPPSEISHEETDPQTNSEDTYSDNTYEETDSYKEEDHKNMMDAMKNISDPTYCSLCKGTGIEENRARGMGLGDDDYGRVCPMCDGTGRRSY